LLENSEMESNPRADMGARAIAVVRVATGIIFLFFGEYKIVGPSWAHGGFFGWIQGFVNNGEAVGFYKMFLVHFVRAHPVVCAEIVGWGEFAIGLSLVLGLWVRAASVGGAIEMIALALSTWYAPGHGMPTWRYFGANLDHIPLLFLFAIFFASRAGETWGLDGVLRARHRRGPAANATGRD
jgi:thiosulfate dehydrogenase (quinone) large subunit